MDRSSHGAVFHNVVPVNEPRDVHSEEWVWNDRQALGCRHKELGSQPLHDGVYGVSMKRRPSNHRGRQPTLKDTKK